MSAAKTKKRVAANDAHQKKKPPTLRCHTCAAKIPIPKGWSRGAAVRRHYWREHPAIMTARRTKLDS